MAGAVLGSVCVASPALAGQVDGGNQGLMSAAVYNLSPYTWTLVTTQSPPNGPAGDSNNCIRLESPGKGPGCWDTLPPSTIAPGGSGLYRLRPWQDNGARCIGNDQYGFDAVITYRVDVLGGAPEYANVVIWGQWTQNICFGSNTDPGFAVYFTSAPPPASYDAWNSGGASPGTQIANPQLTYQHNVPTLYDQSFQIAGNFTVDASTDLGKGFVDVLNAMCAGATNTTCAFTQTGPFSWGIGSLGSPQQEANCSAPGVDPGYATLQYTAAQSASLTVGGGVTASVEFNLFNSIASEASVSVEAEHEWEEVKTLTRMATINIPAGDYASTWVVPVVGTVTGTLVVSNGSATFTATNFSEVRSGVTKDAETPAFNVITQVRPMNAGNRPTLCPLGASGLLGAAPPPPRALLSGGGVARLTLGETKAQVRRVLGAPSAWQFWLNPCRGLDSRCYATKGTGGVWTYPRLSVLFGPDQRVSGLLYSGAQRVGGHVGVGSTLAAIRLAFPHALCTQKSGQAVCVQTRASGAWARKTVFRLRRGAAGRLTCRQVQIYLIHDTTRQVGA